MTTARVSDGPVDLYLGGVEAEQVVTPMLRGWLHLLCFFATIPAGMWLVVESPSGTARAAVGVYVLGLLVLFGASGTYHRRRWSATWRARLKRVDHGAIFVMIAGTYTPVCLVALGGALGTLMLVSVWIGAITGVVLAAAGAKDPTAIISTTIVATFCGTVAAVTTSKLLQRFFPYEEEAKVE